MTAGPPRGHPDGVSLSIVPDLGGEQFVEKSCACCGLVLPPDVGVLMCVVCFTSATTGGRGDMLFCNEHKHHYDPKNVTA